MASRSLSRLSEGGRVPPPPSRCCDRRRESASAVTARAVVAVAAGAGARARARSETVAQSQRRARLSPEGTAAVMAREVRRPQSQAAVTQQLLKNRRRRQRRVPQAQVADVGFIFPRDLVYLQCHVGILDNVLVYSDPRPAAGLPRLKSAIRAAFAIEWSGRRCY